MKNPSQLAQEITALRADIAWATAQGLTATARQWQRKIEALKAEMSRQKRHGNRALGIRTRNGDAFPGKRWESLS